MMAIPVFVGTCVGGDPAMIGMAFNSRTNVATASTIDVAGILGKDPWFREVPELLQSAVLKMGVVRRLRTGQRLFSRGDATNGVYAVLEGRLARAGDGGYGRA